MDNHTNSHILACVLCRRRRVKCDRKMPCSACTKVNGVCIPGVPAPPRKRRRPAQELRERIARFEALIQDLHYENQDQTTNYPVQSSKTVGKLILQGGRLHFTESHILASMHDELDQMRIIVDETDSSNNNNRSADVLVPGADLYLGLATEDSSESYASLLPHPLHVFRLWQLFLDRVNPLTKIIHAPSLQPYVIEAATAMHGMPLSVQALLFSLYAMAVVSLSESECIEVFHTSRSSLRDKYMAGARLSLINLNFLHNYDMTALQALLLYLFSLEDRHDRHAIWMLSGTSIRIAQKLGYHRDGTILGLNPFETEMRRRIWWHIIMQDAKLSNTSGMSQSLLPRNWDTKSPQNINDAEMFPNSTHLIYQRDGPTEMAFILLLNQVFKFRQATDNPNGPQTFEAAILGERINDDKPTSESTFQKLHLLTQQFNQTLLDLEEKCINVTAGPVHVAALCIRPLFASKWAEMLIPINNQPEWGTEISGPGDSLFKYIIVTLEYKIEAQEKMAACGFAWFMRLHFELDLVATMVGKLCQRPIGTLTDRAWDALGKLYNQHPELFNMEQKRYYLLAQNIYSAWEARTSAYGQANWTIGHPSFITRLKEACSPDRCTSS